MLILCKKRTSHCAFQISFINRQEIYIFYFIFFWTFFKKCDKSCLAALTLFIEMILREAEKSPRKEFFLFFLRGKFIARHRQVTSMKNGRGPMFPGRLVLIYSSFPRIKRWKKIFKNEEKYGKIADSFNLNSGNFC